MNTDTIKQMVAGLGIAGLVASSAALASAASHQHDASPATGADKPAPQAGPSGCSGKAKADDSTQPADKPAASEQKPADSPDHKPGGSG